VAIRLKLAGFDDFTLIERGERLGGTWRDNDYPGAACDVRSHLYSFSFAPHPGWSRAFAPQAEILAYLERCADAYGLRPHLELGVEVRSARYDEASGLWSVATGDGRVLRARWLVAGCGGLSRPSLPALEGLADFGGPVFHSARWRHDVPLEGKRVAVVGTGASAIQIVPALAPKAARLALFQRTPPWVLPKADAAIGPGARALFGALPLAQRLARLAIYARNELVATGFVGHTRLLPLVERMARRHLAASVADPALRAKLTPDYRLGCKRVLISDDYYAALARPNVELITAPVAALRPGAVVDAEGREWPADAVVFATGFQAAEAAPPFEVRGRGGADLAEAWRDGPEAFLGTTVAGFPNFFLIVGPNTGLGHSSMVLMIEAQAQYVASAIETMRARGLKAVEVRRGAQDAYNRGLQRRLAGTVWARGGCTSWYQTRAGKNTTLWPGYTFEFRRRTRRFDPRDYELEPLGPARERGVKAGAPAAASAPGLAAPGGRGGDAVARPRRRCPRYQRTRARRRAPPSFPSSSTTQTSSPAKAGVASRAAPSP
ncbi:MAG TPA: NAD(P)/FAD-dependent oxidoreductase, partial [Polyangiaceae bacterium]|nr:NAD(P)/FAD-dependent oxidoreductase [Polyangiaceae bacterium]